MSYLPMGATRHERRERLLSTHAFECACERCQCEAAEERWRHHRARVLLSRCSCGTCARRARARYTRSHALERARLATCATTGRNYSRSEQEFFELLEDAFGDAAAATSRNERASRESSVNVPYCTHLRARWPLRQRQRPIGFESSSLGGGRALAGGPGLAHALALSASCVEASPLRQRLSPGSWRRALRLSCAWGRRRLLDAAAQHLDASLRTMPVCGKSPAATSFSLSNNASVSGLSAGSASSTVGMSGTNLEVISAAAPALAPAPQDFAGDGEMSDMPARRARVEWPPRRS